HNVYALSTFTCCRKVSRGPIERIMAGFTKVLERGAFEQVLSVNASKHAFYVKVVCKRNQDQDLLDLILGVQ
ncbi:hypothetical protein EJ02DRAFT_354850, partial [Clathrospora elynae]